MAEDYYSLKNEILVGNNAKTIRDHLVELENNPKNHQRRWFWELLQNAKDVAIEKKPLKVRLVLKGNELTFMHNGRPFEAAELIHVIFHGSTKDQMEGKTGKFGTGFMTTHLLSKKVRVVGNAKNGAYVDFELDRSPSDVGLLKIALDDSYDNLIGQLKKDKRVDLGDFQTSFTYYLNEKTKKVAEDGILELKSISATVLSFNKEIQSIEVIENNVPWLMNVDSRGQTEIDNLDKVTCSINGTILPVSNLVYKYRDDLQLSFFVQSESNSIIPIPVSIPKIFLDFPLFGSESIGLPMLINSKSFQPLRERTGIYLNPADTEGTHALENQALIRTAIETLPEIARNLSDKLFGDLKYLFGFTTPQVLDWIDCGFMDELYREALTELFAIPTLPFLGEDEVVILRPLNTLFLPVLPDEHQDLIATLHELILTIFPLNTPHKGDWIELNTFRQNWKLISADFVDLNFDFGCTRILKHVESCATLGKLTKDHFDLEVNAIDWLNEVFDLVNLSEQTNLLSLYKCIPNQKNDFVQLVAEKLNLDAIKDEELMDIAKLADWDIRATLVKSEITSLDAKLAPEKLKEFLTKLIAKLNDGKAASLLIKDASLNPLVRLSNWCFEYDTAKLTLIPFIFSNENDDNPKTEGKFLSTDEKALIPAAWWPEHLRSYDQLVSQKFLLSTIYNNIFTAEKIKILDDLGLIYQSPLYFESQNLKQDELLSLLTPESKGKISSEIEIEFVDQSTMVAKLAWFDTGEDNSVIKRTREAKKRTGALIKFLLCQLIINDSSWNETTEVKTTKGEVLNIHPCFWLSRLFSNAWVSTGPKKSENPNAQNITGYIRDHHLMDELLKPKVRKFFGVLNISVTDVLKNIKYGDSEVKRDEWESAILTILHSDVDPKDAAAMVKDSAVVQFYKNRIAEREFIENNQDIGKLFEERFQELFRSEKYKDSGLKIQRVHVGRDYEIAINNDLQDANGQEEFFEIAKGNQKLLLELKATKSEGVGMTTRQVELALQTAEENGLYALVVFPYLTKEDITIPNIETRTKFVNNIADFLIEPYQNKKSLDNKVYVETHRDRVAISCRYEDVRFSILKGLWQDGDDFDVFTAWLFKNVAQSSNAFENSSLEES